MTPSPHTPAWMHRLPARAIWRGAVIYGALVLALALWLWQSGSGSIALGILGTEVAVVGCLWFLASRATPARETTAAEPTRAHPPANLPHD